MDAYGVFDEFYPRSSDSEPDVLDGFQDTVGELAGVQKFEHIFHRVEFRAAGWKVGRKIREMLLGISGPVPSRAIKHDERVAARRDVVADVLQMNVHFGRVFAVADMSDEQIATRARCGEEVAKVKASVARDPGPSALANPDPRGRSLLPYAVLILDLSLDRPCRIASGSLRQLAQALAESFLCRMVGLGARRTRRHVREVQQQQFPRPFQCVRDSTVFINSLHDVAQAKVRRGILLQLRTRFSPFANRFLLLFRQQTPAATARERTQSIHATPVAKDYPDPHRLGTHALYTPNIRAQDGTERHPDHPRTIRTVFVLSSSGILPQFSRSMASLRDRRWNQTVIPSQLQIVSHLCATTRMLNEAAHSISLAIQEASSNGSCMRRLAAVR